MSVQTLPSVKGWGSTEGSGGFRTCWGPVSCPQPLASHTASPPLADGCARLPWICTTGFLRPGHEVLARSATELEHGDSQGLSAVGLQWSPRQLEKDHGQASCCPRDSESLWACPGQTGVSQGGGGLRQGGPFPSATATLFPADHKGLPAEGVEKGSQNPPASDSVVLAVSGTWLFERDTLTGFLFLF